MESSLVSNKKKSFLDIVKDSMFVRSAKELASLRCLCVTAILIALDLVLKLTVSIQITSYIKISFAFLALSAIGMLYGPTVGFIAGLITDVLGFIIKPTGEFNFWFTLIEALGGLIYGLFLYNAINGRWILPRIIAAKATVVIVCNLFLTTYAIAVFYGSGFFALLPARVISNLLLLPFDVMLMYIFLPNILRAYNQVFKGVRKVPDKTVFCDSGMTAAMLYLICAILILVCGLGFAGNDLKTKNTDLKKKVAEQEEEINQLRLEMDAVYDKLGLEKPELPAEEGE